MSTTVGKFFAAFEAMRWDPDEPGSVEAIMAWLAADDVACGLIGAGENTALSLGRGGGGLVLEPGEWIVRDGVRRYGMFPDDAFKATGFTPAAGYLVLRRDEDDTLHDDWDGKVHPTLREGVQAYRDGDRAGYEVHLAALVEVEA